MLDFFDDTTFKTSKCLSDFPISYCWLIEGKYIAWRTCSESSKFNNITILRHISTGQEIIWD